VWSFVEKSKYQTLDFGKLITIEHLEVVEVASYKVKALISIG
jgi:hypothetical protein